MKTGIANVACATITGFSSKIDRLLERKRARRVRPSEPELPVLSALSGSYRRMSGGLLPVKQQTIAPAPLSGAVVVMGWPAPVEGSRQRVGRERRAV